MIQNARWIDFSEDDDSVFAALPRIMTPKGFGVGFTLVLGQPDPPAQRAFATRSAIIS
jgi:hypothetical protein